MRTHNNLGRKVARLCLENEMPRPQWKQAMHDIEVFGLKYRQKYGAYRDREGFDSQENYVYTEIKKKLEKGYYGN